MPAECDPDPGLLETPRVRFAFVAQHVEPAREYDRRRESAQVGREQRRRARVERRRVVRQVVRPEPIHVALGKEEPFGEESVRRVLRREVRDRIGEELRRRARTAVPTRELRDDGGEVAARAVARDGDPGGVEPELGRMRRGPAKRGERVVDGGRKPVLGSQAIVDRQHPGVGLAREMAARRVVRVEVADHPAAAVVVDDEWATLAVVERHVQSRGDRPGRSGEDAVLDARDRWRRPREYASAPPHLRAGVRGRHRSEAAMAGQGDEPQHELILRGELLPVDPDRPAAGEEALQRRRERRKEANHPSLKAIQRRHASHVSDSAPRAPPPRAVDFRANQALTATINGVPFESRPSNLTASYNALAGIYTINAQSIVPGDNRTLIITLALDPESGATGIFNTLPRLTMTYVAATGGSPFVLNADPISFLTSGAVDVTGNQNGQVSGEFEADLIETNGGSGAVQIRAGIFSVRESF